MFKKALDEIFVNLFSIVFMLGMAFLIPAWVAGEIFGVESFTKHDKRGDKLNLTAAILFSLAFYFAIYVLFGMN